jgi:3'(2'), 5'-bisphosphate nucleotidase
MIFMKLLTAFLFASGILATSSAEASSIQPVQETSYKQELSVAKQVALDASTLLLSYWQNEDLIVETKPGEKGRADSLVSEADIASNELICSSLVRKFPGYGILSEEKTTNPDINQAMQNWDTSEYCWYIDPLDGSQAFSEGKSDFGIHIGLCHNGIPVLGVNYFPVLKTMYWAVENQGAFKQFDGGKIEPICARQVSQQVVPIYSSSGTISYYSRLLDVTAEEIELAGLAIISAGHKVSVIAEGSADILVTTAKNSGLWDYCSSHTILKEAGGIATDHNGNELDFREPNGNLPNGYISCGDKAFHQKMIEAIRRMPQGR